VSQTSDYSKEELIAIYELGRLYFEMGYFIPAERVFSGLAAVDKNQTCARLGLGLVKIEQGMYQDAVTHLRLALQQAAWEIQAKLGLCATFIASGEEQRARSLLGEVSKAVETGKAVNSETKRLLEAFWLSCHK
jgi:lipopolysaccharide biosynthesis regulator YciM